MRRTINIVRNSQAMYPTALAECESALRQHVHREYLIDLNRYS